MVGRSGGAVRAKSPESITPYLGNGPVLINGRNCGGDELSILHCNNDRRISNDDDDNANDDDDADGDRQIIDDHGGRGMCNHTRDITVACL